ncbi:DUF4163 domain-containing protein [Sphingomicrobium sp. XHP0239]|uniref:PdaC/SigV domain-containing protein n=1 Tax=Sphingomicrobium maritimum TaxID=3133972 RepID=UPI0031CCA6A6
MTNPAPFPVGVAFLLCACAPQDDGALGQPETTPEPPVAMSDPPAPQAQPSAVRIVEQNALIDFTASWPAEAAAVEAIDARFREQAATSKAELIRMAEEEGSLSTQQQREFNGLSTSTEWTTAGESELLLSLSAAVSSYTGGAHPNYGTATLLWDRAANEERRVSALFGGAGSMTQTLGTRFCDRLDAERDDRRGGIAVDGMFGECPPLSDISVIPTDSDRNGLFDQFVLVADPYVAGPYAEGEYRITLPVDAAIAAALDARYAGEFETVR